MNVIDFTQCPPRMFLFLADMSEGNARLRRIWLRNYQRVINTEVTAIERTL